MRKASASLSHAFRKPFACLSRPDILPMAIIVCLAARLVQCDAAQAHRKSKRYLARRCCEALLKKDLSICRGEVGVGWEGMGWEGVG